MRPLLAGLLGGMLALLAAQPSARADDPGEVAIPPGQEELISEMLGRGQLLPGDCRWAGASVDPAAIVTRYACPGGEVLFELRHPKSPGRAVATTGRFAVALRGGQPPDGLVDALAARIRAREAAFLWSGSTHDVEVVHRGSRVVGGALAAFGALALGLFYGLVRLRRAFAPASAARGRAWAAALVAAPVLGFGVRRALLAFGDAIFAVLDKRPPGVLIVPLAAVLGYTLLVTAAAFFVGRAPSRRVAWAFAAAVSALALGGGYARGLGSPGEEHRFGKLATFRPGTQHDTSPGHGGKVYEINALGFRGPDFRVEKAPEVTRIALVGDSFVFGIGVEWADTLGVSLEAELSRRVPGRRFEALNLAFPGENLSSYVDTYEEACARLDPDVVVMCLILPNDLSRWDAQVKHREARRAGAFSAAQYLLGPDPASMLWDYALVDVGVTDAGLAHLDASVEALSRLRRASGGRPPMVIFAYAHPVQEVEDRLARVPRATLVWPAIGENMPESFIPGDGHPTGTGNRRFAGLIADALLRDGALAPGR